MMFTLNLVFEALTGVHPQGYDREILGAAIDSRNVSPGCMFIALPGERVDGHDFIQEAFSKGASIALIERDVSANCQEIDLREPWSQDYPTNVDQGPICMRVDDSLEAMQQIARFWRRNLDLRVIGITGSVGKSTTKELAAEVINQRYKSLKSSGNLNNEIGLPLTILQLGEHHERAILEMGFYVPGEINFLCDLALPQVGVVTNVGTVHAERAGSIEAIATGKAELVEALPPGPEGIAILNYDDPIVRAMADQTQARVFFYGLNRGADLWADNVEGLGLDGIRFRLHYRQETLHIRVPLIGRHSVHTALRAAAIGLVEGLTWQEIIDGLQSGKVQLRLVAVRASSGALLLDDTYNASPESTLAALNLLDDLEGRKVAVLGDMLELGQYEQQGHALVGARVAEIVDELVTVGERALMIAEAAVRSGLAQDRINEFTTSDQAVDYLLGSLTSQDVVPPIKRWITY
jgi:UDP-N-acetylmuramoyl-tripeptide--D-alanyl-D-alanine ligase